MIDFILLKEWWCRYICLFLMVSDENVVVYFFIEVEIG